MTTLPSQHYSYLGGSQTTYASRPYTGTRYSGPVPPIECGNGCDIEASRVRILFWPVDEIGPTTHNTSDAAALTPYTTVSEGFTL